MLNFIPLKEDVNKIKEYIENSEITFCDVSYGVKYMWRESFKIEYAVFDETIILKESCIDYENAFYYPVGKNVDGALKEIEKYCKEKGLSLKFCCIDNNFASVLSQKYQNTRIYNMREWSDYIYEKQTFLSYSGKHLSGQRNHVNKFKKLYQYEFRKIEKGDLPAIKKFLDSFNANVPYDSWTQKQECDAVFDLIKNMWNLNNFGAMITVNNKIVAISVGEIVKNTLIVHVEKGLKEYEGVYPTMAQLFVKEFANEKVKYINREEDCGDMGLRTSKLQYHPIEIKQKNIVEVGTLFDKIDEETIIRTERLILSKIDQNDVHVYTKLYLDDELNKFWGYDYREDLHGKIPDENYFNEFLLDMKNKKEEFSFAIKKDGKMIGDFVIHNFDYHGQAEIGFRIEKKHQNKGYCTEVSKKMIDYLFNTLNARKILCCHVKENLASKKVIEKLNMKFSYSDGEKDYYILEKCT